MKISMIMAAAICGTAFGADWHDGELTVLKGDPVTLTVKNMTNSCLVLHDNFTVELGAKGEKYSVGTATTTPSDIKIGPDAGDYAVFSLRKATMNSESVGSSDKQRAKATVGENGGNGVMKVGTEGTWKQAEASLATFTLPAAAQTSEDDFPALEIGYISQFNVSTIYNYNAKPLRIRFVNPVASREDYPGMLRSYWKSNDGFLHVGSASSFIILEGGNTGTYKSSICIRHWYGGNLINTILTTSSAGRLKTTANCDLYFDTIGSGVFKIASSKYDWEHSGDTILLSIANGGTKDQLRTTSGKLVMGVTDGLPHGPQTGILIARTNPSATSYSTIDLAGYSQKLNGLVLEGPSKLVNSGAGDAIVTFGSGGGSGRVTGDFTQEGNIHFAKAGTGVLTLSNAMFTSLCVTGGVVRVAPGTVNAIGTLAVTNAIVEFPCDAAGASLTVGEWLLGEGAERRMSLPSDQPSNVVCSVTATIDRSYPFVKDGNGYLTCMTPADANGADLDVRGGVLRMGGCACGNKYWKMVFKKSAAENGIYTYTDSSLPAFKFEMTLGLGNLGLFTANGLQAMFTMSTAAVGTEAAALQENQCSSKNPYVEAWSNSLFKELYSTSKDDPVLGGGRADKPSYFLIHYSNGSSALYDDKSLQDWAGNYSHALVFTNGTNKALDPEDPQTWEEIRWRESATAAESTSYNLRRFVNNNGRSRAHPTDWELWSSADGTAWVKMDERTGQTFDLSTEGAMMNQQYCYTYNHHVPYLFESQNGNWRFDTFGTVKVASGAVLDLDSIPDANVAINALSVDLTAGAGTITKFVPAANGSLYLANPRASDYASDGRLKSSIELPIDTPVILSPENLKSWKVFVDGAAFGSGELAVQNGKLLVKFNRGLVVFLR